MASSALFNTFLSETNLWAKKVRTLKMLQEEAAAEVFKRRKGGKHRTYQCSVVAL